MSKLRIPHCDYLTYRGEGHEEYWFHCPGCKFDHTVIVQWGANERHRFPRWRFNNDLNEPTFEPSLLFEGDGGKFPKCHFYIRQGKLEYLSDCAHELKGQTISMMEV